MNENILQSFKSESAPCIKLLSLKRKRRLWIIETSCFLKQIPSRFLLTSALNISILPAHLLRAQTRENLIFALVWMKMQIHSLLLGATFGALKIAVSPVTAVHKMKSTKQTNHRRLASRKGGVWKNESSSESFGSRWGNKVKINAYYKKMKVFFDLAWMSTCCWWLPKPKYEPFITHNRGTLKTVWRWAGQNI